MTRDIDSFMPYNPHVTSILARPPIPSHSLFNPSSHHLHALATIHFYSLRFGQLTLPSHAYSIPFSLISPFASAPPPPNPHTVNPLPTCTCNSNLPLQHLPLLTSHNLRCCIATTPRCCRRSTYNLPNKNKF